jgi:hypothetical protein
MRENVVIFGAGASYGAREPKPPLGKHLHQWVLRYFEKNYDELAQWEQEWGTDIDRQILKDKLKNATSYEARLTPFGRKTSQAL